MADTPIIINPSALPELVTTLIRYLASPVGGILASHGWIMGDQKEQVAGVMLAIAAGGWGIYRAWRNKQKLVSIASDPRTPDSVASVAVK